MCNFQSAFGSKSTYPTLSREGLPLYQLMSHLRLSQTTVQHSQVWVIWHHSEPLNHNTKNPERYQQPVLPLRTVAPDSCTFRPWTLFKISSGKWLALMIASQFVEKSVFAGLTVLTSLKPYVLHGAESILRILRFVDPASYYNLRKWTTWRMLLFRVEVRKCLLSFVAESFVFQVAIQKFKDQDT